MCRLTLVAFEPKTTFTKTNEKNEMNVRVRGLIVVTQLTLLNYLSSVVHSANSLFIFKHMNNKLIGLFVSSSSFMTKEGVCWCTIKCRHFKNLIWWGGGEKLTNFSTKPSSSRTSLAMYSVKLTTRLIFTGCHFG